MYSQTLRPAFLVDFSGVPKNTAVGFIGFQERLNLSFESRCDPYLCKQKMKSNQDGLLREFRKNTKIDRL